MATFKQIAVAKKLAENVGMPVSKAMLAVGYAKETADVPQRVTESKAWPALLEKYLPDYKLLGKHDQALEATKWNDFTGEREEDHAIRLRAVELAYKLKKRLSPEGGVQVRILNSIEVDRSKYSP